jgi:succinate dehydrogenase / fumarate reductase cytochrome b subunit
MTSPLTASKRPLSPHLQVYKPQLTSGMSIFHRITGIALAAGLPVFVAWVVALAGSEQLYATFTGLFNNIVGQVLLAGWSFCFFYHFCSGIRHLVWDAGYALSIKSVYISGYIAIAIALLLTAYVWLKIYGIAP